MNKFAEIFKPYFDRLSGLVGQLANDAIRNNVRADDIAREYLSKPNRQEHFRQQVRPAIYKVIENFWYTNTKIVNSELARLPGLRARLGGDLGPQFSDNLFQRTGLYFDTILIPDPLLRVSMLAKMSDKNDDYYLLKYCITHLLLKDIYLADVNPPIAVLVADKDLAGPGLQINELMNLAKIDSIILTNELYGQKFNDFNEVQVFFSRFQNLREAAQEVHCPELLILDENATVDPVSQVETCFEKSNKDWDLDKLPVEFQGAGFLLFSLIGRMNLANEALHSAYAQNAHPIIAAPVSFHWLAWKIRANQRLVTQSIGIETKLELALTNALLSKNLKWFSNVPIEALIELRRKGRLSELRSIIRQETGNFEGKEIENLEVIISQIDQNLYTALERHQEQLSELDKKFRLELAISGPSFLVSITAALQPAFASFLPEWTKALGGVIGMTNLKAIIEATAKYFKERKALKKSPVGILWHAKKASE